MIFSRMRRGTWPPPQGVIARGQASREHPAGQISSIFSHGENDLGIMLDLYEPVPREYICMLTQVHTLHTIGGACTVRARAHWIRSRGGTPSFERLFTSLSEANSRLSQTMFIRGIRHAVGISVNVSRRRNRPPCASRLGASITRCALEIELLQGSQLMLH